MIDINFAKNFIYFDFIQNDVKMFNLIDFDVVDLENNFDILEKYVKNIHTFNFNINFNIQIIDIFIDNINTIDIEIFETFDVNFSRVKNLIINMCLHSRDFFILKIINKQRITIKTLKRHIDFTIKNIAIKLKLFYITI